MAWAGRGHLRVVLDGGMERGAGGGPVAPAPPRRGGDAPVIVTLPTGRCHCGRPLHYTDATIAALMARLVAELGEYIPITVGGRTWRVQRHYAALHGIRARDLPTLGFEEVLA
jgi:hypothetical protein